MFQEEITATLKRLMEQFISDVQKGMSSSQAGWIVKTTEMRRVQPKFLEEKNGKVRILVREELPSHLAHLIGYKRGQDILALADMCLDMRRMDEARELFVTMVEGFGDSPEHEWCAIGLGLREMLENIGNCVALDLVLEGGFNAVDWHNATHKVSTELALTLTNKWCNITQTCLEQLSRKLGFKLNSASDVSIVAERVKQVLNWEEGCKELGIEETKALGLLWLADKLLVLRGACLPETSISMKEKTWELISKRIGKGETELMENVEVVTNRLSERSKRFDVITVNWVEIFRPPW